MSKFEIPCAKSKDSATKAAAAGDTAMVVTCEAALDGDAEALEVVRTAIKRDFDAAVQKLKRLIASRANDQY